MNYLIYSNKPTLKMFFFLGQNVKNMEFLKLLFFYTFIVIILEDNSNNLGR